MLLKRLDVTIAIKYNAIYLTKSFSLAQNSSCKIKFNV